MKVRLALSSLALACASIAAPPALRAQDLVQVAPAAARVLFEDDRVRVVEVVYKPGFETPVHTHPEYAAYALDAGKLRVKRADGQTETFDIKAGEAVHFQAEGPHSTVNLGKKPFRAIYTELKGGAPSGKLSAAERDALLELYDRGLRETEELVASTPDALWAKKPAPDRWSVAEVVEHLGLAESLLFDFAQQGLANPVSNDWANLEAGMTDEQFVGMLKDRSKRFQAPEPIQPHGGLSRADALAKLAGARAVTAEFLRRTDAELKKHVVQGPAGPMTAHQVFVLIGGHNLRHNEQIREALQQLNSTASK